MNINGIQYNVIKRDDASQWPNIRKRMDEVGIKGYIYLQRPKGKKIYQAIEHNHGLVRL